MNPSVWKTLSSFFLISLLFPLPSPPRPTKCKHMVPDTLLHCQMLKVHELQTHRNGHAGSNAVIIQSNSGTDKRQSNFLEGMPQKADMHCLPVCMPRSIQLGTALKHTGKPEMTSQAPLLGAGYPTGKRSTTCWGRMLSRPPYRHKQLHSQKLLC